MAGHSHWANISRKKGAVDAKRGKIFTKLAREITVAARMGGGSPDFNPRLKLALVNARLGGMTKDTIERAIKKGTGELEGENIEEVVYEGYGPAGVAMMIEATTDNRNRTVADLRFMLDRHNGSLGQNGSVGWMFSKQGRIQVTKSALSEDAITEAALDAGASDIKDEEGFWAVVTEADSFHAVRSAMENKKIPIASAELTMVPQTTVKLAGKDAETMVKLLTALDDHDDVQKIHANFEIDEKEMNQLAGA